MTIGTGSFTCPECQMTSHHPDDAKHGYCGACHAFTEEPTELVVAGNRAVAGHCPMGCGTTLFVGSGGHITCSYIPCPDPCAVDQILGDAETEHVVEFRAGEFTVRHPLRERIGDALLTCSLHTHLAGLPGPPVQLGRYRARFDGVAWAWQALSP